MFYLESRCVQVGNNVQNISVIKKMAAGMYHA